MTKNQHYVPRFYLKNFANSCKCLYAYNIKDKRIISTTPESICLENNLYETELKDANEKMGKYVIENDIENKFCKHEGNYNKLIEKIKSICVQNQNEDALILNSSDEKELLYSLIANLIVRNPKNIGYLNNLQGNIRNSGEYQTIDNMLKQMDIGGTESIFIAAQKRVGLTEDFENSVPKIITEQLRKTNFTFYYALENEFLTSDVPIIFGNDTYLPRNDIGLYFAITPKIAIIFGNYKISENKRNRMVKIKGKYVDSFNKIFFDENNLKFQRWIIGTSEEILRKYTKEMK